LQWVDLIFAAHCFWTSILPANGLLARFQTIAPAIFFLYPSLFIVSISQGRGLDKWIVQLAISIQRSANTGSPQIGVDERRLKSGSYRFSVPVLIVMSPSRRAIPRTSRSVAQSFHGVFREDEGSAPLRFRCRIGSYHEHEVRTALKSSGADPSPSPSHHRRQTERCWLGSGWRLVKVEDGVPG
jgi:hypothetical protein